MDQVASVSFLAPSGSTVSLRIDQERGQYVLSRRDGDELLSSETFASKRELQFFLSRPNCSKGEEALGLVLLQARFFDHENRNELGTLFSDYPKGLVLVGHAAVRVYDNQVYRVCDCKDHFYYGCYVSQDLIKSICERESVMQIKDFNWCEMFRDSCSVQLYAEGKHTLAIPYSDIERHSAVIDGIRVAAKEHLLVLTIDAALMRSGPQSSLEDRKDLVALVLGLIHPKGELLASVLNEDRLTYLRAIAKDSQIFEEMFACYPDLATQFLVWYKERILIFENLVDYIGLRNYQLSDLEGETVPLHDNFNRLPVSVSDVVFDGPVTTIRALCETAGVRFRISDGEIPSVVLSEATGNLRAFDLRNRPVYVVDRNQFIAKTPQEEALRILEVVAYSFGDRAVAQCIHGLLGW